MKKGFLLFIISVTAFASIAHEFWLQPQRFHYQPGETAVLSIRVGENFHGEPWGNNGSLVAASKHIQPSGNIADLLKAYSDKQGDSISVTLNEAGTHLITLQTKNKFIQLKPTEFAAYLKEDGLQLASDYRAKNKELDKDGKEFYQRSVKTIVQAGNSISNACLQQTGLPLDIVPTIHPYTNPKENTYTIYFQGKPLDGALVKSWVKGQDTKMTEQLSNAKGQVRFQQSIQPTMISCVHMVRLPEGQEADWQSYWASLTFYTGGRQPAK
ncbi:MAG: DUF4198 domain-containing protein [Chitinophagales bacterium]|nr:DUF4198 domain-containing protein [Chitinophagales bacterium]